MVDKIKNYYDKQDVKLDIEIKPFTNPKKNIRSKMREVIIRRNEKHTQPQMKEVIKDKPKEIKLKIQEVIKKNTKTIDQSKEILKYKRLAAVNPKMNFKSVAELNEYKQSVAERVKKKLENDKVKKLEAAQKKEKIIKQKLRDKLNKQIRERNIQK